MKTKLGPQDDFAEVFALFHQLVGLGALGEWKDATDHGAQLALTDEFQDVVEFAAAAHVRTQQ